LKETDAVIVTSSSVGMEAIIYNKPIFQHKSDEYVNYRLSYEDFDCSQKFTTGADLLALISDKTGIFSRLKNYSSFVEYYFYKLDGQSALRAAEYIKHYPAGIIKEEDPA
jgi:hypothetical protein